MIVTLLGIIAGELVTIAGLLALIADRVKR
jgi:hypothetical protein